MVATIDSRAHLIHALEVLLTGDSARFEDALWIAFGDDWTGVVQRLRGRKIVRYRSKEDDYALTKHGRAVLIQSRNARVPGKDDIAQQTA